MAYHTRQRWKTYLAVEAYRFRSREAVGNPPTDPRQKTDIRSIMEEERDQTVEPYRRISARRQQASLKLWWGGRPITGGDRRRIVAKTTLARVCLWEQWALK